MNWSVSDRPRLRVCAPHLQQVAADFLDAVRQPPWGMNACKAIRFPSTKFGCPFRCYCASSAGRHSAAECSRIRLASRTQSPGLAKSIAASFSTPLSRSTECQAPNFLLRSMRNVISLDLIVHSAETLPSGVGCMYGVGTSSGKRSSNWHANQSSESESNPTPAPSNHSGFRPRNSNNRERFRFRKVSILSFTPTSFNPCIRGALRFLI